MREVTVLKEKKDITLKEEFYRGELFTWGDEDKLSEVVNNLLNNAIKYTPEKGEVTLRVFPSDNFVKIEVQDTGEGIPADKLDKIFDKFERFSKSGNGSGLGLAIAKDIIELHGGKIWAESKLGEGSKFITVLPLNRAG